jgi:FkbM family methyltransferase
MSFKRMVRDTLGDHRVRRLKSLRTRAACKLDMGPWRRPGLNGLDVRLADALEWRPNGMFIELGGNDGLQQSNSFLLERELGWRGILIEAVPELAAEAARNRPHATIVCAAVSSASHFGIASMDEQDLVSKMSTTPGRLLVATTTLSTIVDQVTSGEPPDLLSIDVEGHEIDVLEGLDLTRHRPRWILVETAQRPNVSKALECYELVAQLSYHDYLYRLNRS